MRIAVIGAGIVGVASAHALARAGHQVTVIERRGSVATEGSFANAGLLSPALVAGWGADVLLEPQRGRAGQTFNALARSLRHPSMTGWWWRAWLTQRPHLEAARRPHVKALALQTLEELQGLSLSLDLGHEQRQGCMVLLRSKREAAAAKLVCDRLTEAGDAARWLTLDEALEIEPGLNPKSGLQAAVHLPGDAVANSRQVAHLLKADAQRMGAVFRFDHTVVDIQSGPPLTVLLRDEGQVPQLGKELLTEASQAVTDTLKADAVVLCTGLGSPKLLQSLGLNLPLLPIHGYSVTAPLPLFEAMPDPGPRAALVDLGQQVSISRLGDRIRVSGGLRRGGQLKQAEASELKRLYRVLDLWFEGVARTSKAQEWHGARPCLPDNLPVIGPSAKPGIWLNLGHGNLGWTLGLGGAKMLAAQISGQNVGPEAAAFSTDRFR